MDFRPRLSALAACSLAVALARAQATSVTVGDPSNPTKLGQALQEAYASGSRDLRIQPGVYQMVKTDQDDILLEGWKEATIHAEGVTILADEQPGAIFHLDHCDHVALEGPVLENLEVTSYQGKVSNAGIDPNGGFACDWQPDAGYPMVPAGTTALWVNVVDAHTRLLKLGTGDFYNVKWQSLGNGSFHLTNFGKAPHIVNGDWLVARRDVPIALKVHLDNSTHCTVKNVTMFYNGFAPIFETGGSGNHILGCCWLPGPRPAGAMEDPLVTNAADGFHSVGTKVGPDIENCLMKGVFLDDCFAIHGEFSDVVSTNGAEVVVKGNASWTVGQPIVVCDQKGHFQEAKLTAVAPTGPQIFTVTTAPTLTIGPSSKAYNPEACGAGYKIIACRLGDTRSRGILAKANDGLIERNLIERCGMSAVSLGPEYYWGEGGYVSRVLVDRNLFDQNGTAGYGGATVLVHGEGAPGNRFITIRANLFKSSYQGDIDLEWTQHALISRNAFFGSTAWPAFMIRQPTIQVTNSAFISLNRNEVRNVAGYKQPILAVGPNASIEANDDGLIPLGK